MLTCQKRKMLRSGRVFLQGISGVNREGRLVAPLLQRCYSTTKGSGDSQSSVRKAKTPVGRLDDKWEGKKEQAAPQKRPDEVNEEDVYAPFPDDKNPNTGEIGGPKGPEPTRYGDWERKGRVIDF